MDRVALRSSDVTAACNQLFVMRERGGVVFSAFIGLSDRLCSGGTTPPEAEMR